MKPEIEAKFLHVDFEALRAKLKAAGATCEQPMRLMRRVLIENETLRRGGRHAFVRIRDEGDKVTLTLKEFKDHSLTGASERLVTVSDFDDTVKIFSEVGAAYKSFQESKRETWKLVEDGEGVEIALDQWPWLDPYIEIEGPSETAVQAAAAKLGFEWRDAVFGHVDVAYKEQYPDMTNRGVIDVVEVRFDDPVPAAFGRSRL